MYVGKRLRHYPDDKMASRSPVASGMGMKGYFHVVSSKGCESRRVKMRYVVLWEADKSMESVAGAIDTLHM